MKNLLQKMGKYLRGEKIPFNFEESYKSPREQDKRRWPRHPFLEYCTSWVVLSDKTRISLKNVSYGGMALNCSRRKLEPYLTRNGTIILTLHIGNQSQWCEVYIVHGDDNFTGCSFVHADAATLLFLRNILEYIRIGSTIKATNDHNTDIEACSGADTQFSYYLGDCESQIKIKTDSFRDIKIFHLHFIDSTVPTEMIYNYGKIMANRFDNSQDGTYRALQQSFLILIGFYTRNKNLSLDYILKKIGEEIEKTQP